VGEENIQAKSEERETMIDTFKNITKRAKKIAQLKLLYKKRISP